MCFCCPHTSKQWVKEFSGLSAHGGHKSTPNGYPISIGCKNGKIGFQQLLTCPGIGYSDLGRLLTAPSHLNSDWGAARNSYHMCRMISKDSTIRGYGVSFGAMQILVAVYFLSQLVKNELGTPRLNILHVHIPPRENHPEYHFKPFRATRTAKNLQLMCC